MESSFGKDERLKSRKLIGLLFEEGSSFFCYPYKIVYQKTSYKKRCFPLQTGISVSKRHFKKAVDRNKVKRIFRETFRLQKRSLYKNLKHQENLYTVMWVYVGKEIPDYKTLYAQTGKCLDKLILKINEA